MTPKSIMIKVNRNSHNTLVKIVCQIMKIKKYIRDSFTPKQVVIYESDQVNNYNFGVIKQVLLVILSITCVLFLSYTIASYFINKNIIDYKNRQIAELENKQVFLTSNIKTRLGNLKALSKQEEEYATKIANAKNKDSNKQIYVSFLNNVRTQERNLYADVAKVINESNTIKYSVVNSKINFVGHNNATVQEDTLKADNAVLENTLKKLKEQSDFSIKTNEKLLKQKIAVEEKLAKYRSPVFLKMAKKIINDKIASTSMGGPNNTTLPVRDIVQAVEKRVIDLKNKNAYYNTLKDINDHIPHVAPLASSKYRISSKFGYRTDPFTQKKHFHSGIDLAAMTGVKVHAPLDGVVTLAGKFSGYGNLVELNHSQLYHISSRYGHLSKVLVKRGQSVKKGDVIALVGSTGRSTGPHLHFELLVNREKIDPCYALGESLGSQIKYCLHKKK